MTIKYLWAAEGILKEDENITVIFPVEPEWSCASIALEVADDVIEKHPEYSRVDIVLLRINGEDINNCGQATTEKKDGKLILPKHFLYSGVSNDTRFTTPEQYHKELAEAQQ